MSIGTERNVHEEEDEEDWLSRIGFRGLYLRDLSVMLKLLKPTAWCLRLATSYSTSHRRITPAGRPIAEPPLFNYDNFVGRFVSSVKRREGMLAR